MTVEAPVAESSVPTVAVSLDGVDAAGLALVHGKPLSELPKDLYIPPDALRVFLQAFEGPLDLLLYLIRKQNIDILDIPIAEVTRQYVSYVELMQNLQFELASEYLVMAAMLAEIKSRLLLPRPAAEEEDGGQDPRAELIRRLQEYERFKEAAEQLDDMPRVERDIFLGSAAMPEVKFDIPLPSIELDDLLAALKDVLHRAALNAEHRIEREVLSIRERMTIVLGAVAESEQFVPFGALFTVEEGRMGVVVTFIAILELVRQSVIEFVQAKAFAPIYVRQKSITQEQTHDG